MLYYSFVYSCVNYEITTWGTADRSKKHEIEVKMNNTVRTITWNKKFTHAFHLQSNLGLTDKCGPTPVRCWKKSVKRKCSVPHAATIVCT